MTTLSADEFKKKFPNAKPVTLSAEEFKSKFPNAKPLAAQTGESAPEELPEEPSMYDKIGDTHRNVVKGLSVGAGKGVLTTLKNTAGLVQGGIHRIAAAIDPQTQLSDYKEVGIKSLTKGTKEEARLSAALKPQGGLEKAGFSIERIAEFMVPVGATAKIANYGAKMGTKGQVAFKSLSQGIEFAGKTALQTGDLEETKQAGGLGIAFPILGKTAQIGVRKVAPVVGNLMASVLGYTTGKSPEIIKKAYQNPNEVAAALSQKLIPLDVREKASGALKTYLVGINKEFGKGLKALQKLTPTKDKKGAYNAVKTAMKDEVQKQNSNIVRTFREHRIGVIKGQLDFDKNISSIMKPEERTNIDKVWAAVRDQKDFSPEGVQATAARINALTKYGANGERSALIGEIHDRYAEAIKKWYPGLDKLRKEYAADRAIHQGLDDIIKSSKNAQYNPTSVQTTVNKLVKSMNDDQEAYVRAIMRFEKRTGVNLLDDLAGAELRDPTPSSFGGHIGQIGVIAGGFVHPWVFALLPMFSPNLVGRATIAAGKAAPHIPEVAATASKGIIPTLQEDVAPNFE